MCLRIIHLVVGRVAWIPVYGSLSRKIILEFIETAEHLALAVEAIMRAPAGQEDAPDGRTANQARLSGAEIHSMLELEEASYARGIHIVRDRRTA
jgi:hypothetical protein